MLGRVLGGLLDEVLGAMRSKSRGKTGAKDWNAEYERLWGFPKSLIQFSVSADAILPRYSLKTREGLWGRRKAAKLIDPNAKRGQRVLIGRSELDELDAVHVAINYTPLTLALYENLIGTTYYNELGEEEVYDLSTYVQEKSEGEHQTWKEYAVKLHEAGHVIFRQTELTLPEREQVITILR
jgi:hypothetical protein